MKNRLLYGLYAFCVAIIFFFAYNFYDTKKLEVGQKVVLTLDNSMFLRYKETFDLNQSFGYIWGLKDEKKKVVEQNTTTETMLLVTKKNSSLCVKGDCFRFLGIFHKKNKPFISLYNKNFKHKMKDFTIGENIGYSLYVEDIFQNRTIIADENSSRKWSFALFDVNTTKYKPKDMNETKF